MFMKLSEQMQVGEMRDVTLVFEKAGDIKIGMMVVDAAYLEGEQGTILRIIITVGILIK